MKVNPLKTGPVFSTTRGVSRAFRSVTGSLSGFYNYGMLRTAMVGFAKNEMMIEEIDKESLKKIFRVRNRIKGYNKKLYSKLIKVYSDKPEYVLTNKVNEMIQSFITNIKEFQSAFKDVTDNILTALGEPYNVEMAMIGSVNGKVKELVTIASDGKFVVPQKEATIFKKNLEKAIKLAINTIEKDAKTETVNVQKFSRLDKVAGRINTTFGLNLLFYRGKRLIGRFSKDVGPIMLEIQGILEKEINANKIQVDFFPYLIRYVKLLESVDKDISNLKRNSLRIIDTIEDILEEMIKSVSEFKAIFQNEPGMEDFKKVINQIQMDISALKELIQEDIKLATDVTKALESMKEEALANIVKIGTLSEKTLRDARKAA